MPEQTRKHIVTEKQRDEAAAETRDAAPSERSETHEETLAHTDDLLDEIDEALLALDEDTASSFKQQGGE